MKNESFQDGSIPKKSEIYSSEYIFGYKYYYWNWYKNNFYNINYSKWYINKKYNNLKDEIINNKLYRLNIISYNNVYYKSLKILSESNIIKSIKSDYTENIYHYGIKNNLLLNIDNIISIILYCEYDILCYNLRKTFRKLTFYHETNENMKIRNREYYNWSKLLHETIECYGTMIADTNINKYYHCINNDIILNSFILKFNGPTLMTSYYEIITIFNDNNGILLELQSNDVNSSLKYFNCIYFNCYSIENSNLFIGGKYSFKYNSIQIIKKNENYQHFIKSIQIFDNIINGGINISNINIIKIDNKYYKIIKLLIKNQINDDENNTLIPKYIKLIFKQYCNQIKNIEIDLNLILNNNKSNNKLNDCGYNKFKEILCDKRTNNLILIDYLCKIFKNCKKIIIDNNKKHISTRYLSQLLLMMNIINRNYDNNNCYLQSIKIERIQYNENELNQYIKLFLAKDWRLKVKETRTNQFGEWIDTANLTIIKCQRDSIDDLFDPPPTT